MNPKFLNRIARLLKTSPQEIDVASLRNAVRCVKQRRTEYFDALAEYSQLDGNIPFAVAVAITYEFV